MDLKGIVYTIFHFKLIGVLRTGWVLKTELDEICLKYVLVKSEIPKQWEFCWGKSVFFRAAINMRVHNDIYTSHANGWSSFFPRGSFVHEPRSGEPIFFAIMNPRKWCCSGIYAHVTYPRVYLFACLDTTVSDVFLAFNAQWNLVIHEVLAKRRWKLPCLASLCNPVKWCFQRNIKNVRTQIKITLL